MPSFVLHLGLIVVVGSVVELEKYFEPSFKIIEDNHSFSAADVGGPYGKVRKPLHQPLHAINLQFISVC